MTERYFNTDYSHFKPIGGGILKKRTIHCPYCGAKATLHPSRYVYGDTAKTNGFVYVCDRYPRCDAYVSAHRKSRQPMGTLADRDLRNKRIQAHKAFDRMWKSGHMKKWQAYKWMQGVLDLDERQAHIAMFSEYMCDQLISVCNRAYSNMKMVS